MQTNTLVNSMTSGALPLPILQSEPLSAGFALTDEDNSSLFIVPPTNTGPAGPAGAAGAQGVPASMFIDEDNQTQFLMPIISPGVIGPQGPQGLPGISVFDDPLGEDFLAPGAISRPLDHHNDLKGFLVDDHTIYALLAGRAGGQTLRGGTAASETLVLQSTSNATRGTIDLVDKVRLLSTLSSVTATPTVAVEFNNTISVAGSIALTLFNISPTVTLDTNDTVTLYAAGGVYTNTAAPFFGSFRMFSVNTELKSATAAVNPYPPLVFFSNPTITGDTANVGTLPFFRAFDDGGTVRTIGSGTMTVTELTSYFSQPNVNEDAAGGVLTVTTRRALWVNDVNAGGTPVVTNNIGVDIDAMTQGSTLCAGIRSAITAAANRFFLQDTGGAKSEFAGKFTKYNNVATVASGVPSDVATIDLTAQGAAIGSTLLYTVPAAGAGQYRISYVATVTRAATTSSVLGGTGLGLQIDWTDNDTSVAKLSPAGAAVAAGTNTSLATPTNAANTTAASIAGCIVINAKASTAINYRIGYTSVGATTMQYNLHIICEAL